MEQREERREVSAPSLNTGDFEALPRAPGQLESGDMAIRETFFAHDKQRGRTRKEEMREFIVS